MSLWRHLARGLAVLTNRTAADRDVADEVLHYLDQAATELVAKGLSPDEARRAAQVDLGNATVIREQVRDYGWENVVGTVSADVGYAARRLRANPGFLAVTVLTLALGIGATTAIFSVVNATLFDALPYPNPGRIVSIWYAGTDGSRADQAFGTYRELSARSRSFAAIAALKPWQPTLTGPDEPERIDGEQVSASYFRVLGVPPALGRDFDPADDRVGGPRVVILSDGIWRRRLRADRAIVGRQVTLNDSPYAVVGVMPRGFENLLAASTEIWSLLQYDASLPADGREWGHHLRMVGRTLPDVTVDQAGRDLDRIARAPVRDFHRQPGSSMRQGVIVNPLRDDLTRGVRPALVAVLGAVLLVLAIACVNVTNLLLAQGVHRRGEFAMRAALGAGRARLILQLLAESLLLALIGGALGLVIAELGVQVLVAISPPGLPRLGAIRVNGPVFGFASGISAMIGVAVGLIPALGASHDDLYVGLQRGSRRTASGQHALRRALVVAEVALALTLLVGAGLLLRSLERLFAISPGFNASHVLTMQVQVSSASRFPDDAAVHRFFAQALDAARRVPGVASAAFTSQLPLSGDADVFGVQFEPGPGGQPEAGDAFRYAVTPGYFESMGIPLRRGRLLDERDMSDARSRPVVVNESFARRAFDGRDPIGQRLRFGGPPDRPWDVVVGVVGDVKQLSLAVGQSDALYAATGQWLWADNPMWLVVRARSDAAALAPAIRRAIWSVDKDQPIVRAATMDDLLAASAAERRFVLALFEAFALLALVLAAVGIYGILSGSVTERTREIGVRSALGASRGTILALVARQGLRLTGLGVAIGLGGAVAASHAIAALLFGVSPLDPGTYLGVIVLVFGLSGVACWVPAWRASRVDPSITLRAE
jgi:putative ABC transport system permease protein